MRYLIGFVSLLLSLGVVAFPCFAGLLSVCGCSGESGLPGQFGDCPSPPCEGDFYECIYDAKQGELVGAKWSPDNHPTQFAGVQLPASCSLSNVCDVWDLTPSG